MTLDRHNTVDAQDVEALIRAGDELALMLKRSPGIDPFRSSTLEDWKIAKQRVKDPYGSHLRDVTRGRS